MSITPTITLYSHGQCATFEKRASLQHNRMAQVSLIVERWEEIIPPLLEGTLPGLFSVSATQQVYFSQGNLQYQASTNTWRFAEHQYDRVGSANSNISSTYSGWIDLFGWGTSGWNSGAVCYQPWSTSTTSGDYYPGGSRTNALIGDYAEADWAYHNAISNGGNASHLWRTLTFSEWYYLFNSRTNARQKYGTGFITLDPSYYVVDGLIILPDDWILPSGCSFNCSMHSDDFDDNEYTLAQWAQMEAAGAVFLPISGSRGGTSVGFGGEFLSAYYWSTTPHSYYYPDNNGDDIFVLFFMGSSLSLSPHYRNSGLPIRPVRDNNSE